MKTAILLIAAVAAFAAGAASSAADAPQADLPVFSVNFYSNIAEAKAPLALVVEPAQNGREYIAGFRSDALDIHQAVLQAQGLPEGEYDLYISGRLTGTYPSTELGKGVTVDTGTGIFTPQRRRLLEAHEDWLREAVRELGNDQSKPLYYEVTGTARFVQQLLVTDRRQRTARVLLIENGYAPSTDVSTVEAPVEHMVKRSDVLLADIARIRAGILASDLSAADKQKYLGWMVPLEVRLLEAPDGIRLAVYNADQKKITGKITLALPGECSEGVQPVQVALEPQKSQESTIKLPADCATDKSQLTVEGMVNGAAFRQTVLRQLP